MTLIKALGVVHSRLKWNEDTNFFIMFSTDGYYVSKRTLGSFHK